ncbi:replication-relaxation family protein [Actinocorallia aurantiaca]|uniref:Uncharacterized protein n=1 Tax=Actinocorallia aurantiaca TaxID=46204 RepID=A0ABN3UJJ9_9ACTN
MRRRVLARLVSGRVLVTLARRVGGVRAGSQGLTYALDTAGQLLMQRWHGVSDSAPSRIRRPWTPGQLFLAHSLDVSELYVRLVEVARLHGAFAVERFDAESAAWVENGLSGWLKPDAYVVLVGRSFG